MITSNIAMHVNQDTLISKEFVKNAEYLTALLANLIFLYNAKLVYKGSALMEVINVNNVVDKTVYNATTTLSNANCVQKASD